MSSAASRVRAFAGHGPVASLVECLDQSELERITIPRPSREVITSRRCGPHWKALDVGRLRARGFVDAPFLQSGLENTPPINMEDGINTLDELAIRYGRDKSSLGHGYTRPYYAHLAHLRDSKLKLLEIGVAWGVSIGMWEEFFTHAEVYGLERRARAIPYQVRRGKIFVGDQTDRPFLEKVVREIGPLDVIIDDGSHHPEH